MFKIDDSRFVNESQVIGVSFSRRDGNVIHMNGTMISAPAEYNLPKPKGTPNVLLIESEKERLSACEKDENELAKWEAEQKKLLVKLASALSIV